jgi:pimeloyl-ACP methyl ester carboxylesterase
LKRGQLFSISEAFATGDDARVVEMATYVLVHGGAHGGWCYQPVARILRSRGQEVYTPTLTGLGEREHLLSPSVDLDCHITDVVKLLQFEDLHEVILVGHSYGGMVITGVADRSTDRVDHRVTETSELFSAGSIFSR